MKQEAIPLPRKPPIEPVRSGDVFAIPVDGDRAYIGQIVAKTAGALYVIVYDWIEPNIESIPQIEKVPSEDPLFATLTLDSRFRPGMWKVVGHAETDPDRFLPAFSYETLEPGRVRITDFYDRVHRDATPDEAAAIPAREYRSPMRLEKALRAREGLLPNLPSYDELIYRSTPTSANLFHS